MTDGKSRTRRTPAPKARTITVDRRTRLQTPVQAAERLRQMGITAAQLADDHGFSHATVYKVLSGANKGRHGDAHRVAVLLRIKRGEATVTGSVLVG